MKCFNRKKTLLFITSLVFGSILVLKLQVRSNVYREEDASRVPVVRSQELIHTREQEEETSQTAPVDYHNIIPDSNSGNNYKIILFWGKILYNREWTDFIKDVNYTCDGSYQCIFTTDRNMYPSVDAVVLHGASSTPEDTPDLSIRPLWQRWVFHNMEPRHNQTVFTRSIFNWTHTYLGTSDVQNARGQMTSGKSFGGFQRGKNYLQNRTKTAVSFMDDCSNHQIRAVRRLKKHFDIDVFGNCGRRRCLLHKKGCLRKLKTYKFYLSFEGDICRDYMTEKLYTVAFANQLVPIVMGGTNYSDPLVAPPGSYINGLKFKSVKLLARFIRKVSNSDQLYKKYFKWHSDYQVKKDGYFSASKLTNTVSNFCNLCKALHDNTRPTKQYSDIVTWFNNQNNCRPQDYKLLKK